MRLHLCWVLLVLSVMLVPLTIHTAPSHPAPPDPALIATGSTDLASPLNWCPEFNATTQFDYCAFVTNGVSGGGIPANQSVGQENDTVNTAAIISTVSPFTVSVEWNCKAAIPLHTVIFQLSLFGEVLDRAAPSQAIQGCNGTSVSSFGHAAMVDSDLTSFGMVLSGVFSASVTFFAANGSPVGQSLSFLVKVIPSYPPFTAFIVALSGVFLFEVFLLIRDFRNLRRDLRKARHGPSPPSPTPPPPDAQPPPPHGPRVG